MITSASKSFISSSSSRGSPLNPALRIPSPPAAETKTSSSRMSSAKSARDDVAMGDGIDGTDGEEKDDGNGSRARSKMCSGRSSDVVESSVNWAVISYK